MSDSGLARCGGCDRRWTGLKECHCATCHEHFSTVTNFDAHRVNGRCVKPAKAKIGGRSLKAVERSHGTVWVLDTETEEAA